jgi:hypothetical protein
MLHKESNLHDNTIIQLNVGGKRYCTHFANITKQIPNPYIDESVRFGKIYRRNLLEKLVNQHRKGGDDDDDENLAIFIDRNPHHFQYILDFLRRTNTNEPMLYPETIEDTKALLSEAKYYEMEAIEDFFKYFGDSLIVSRKQARDLVHLCQLAVHDTWKLLYRASRDGYAGADFHAKCDDHFNTLTLIKTKDGEVYGGFTNAKWNDQKLNDKVKYAIDSFIFSLINKYNKPFKNRVHQIYCDETHGPCIGDSSHGIITGEMIGRLHVSDAYRESHTEKFTELFLIENKNKCKHFEVMDIEVYVLL